MYYNIHTKCINTQYGQHSDFLVLKLAVHTITISFEELIKSELPFQFLDV